MPPAEVVVDQAVLADHPIPTTGARTDKHDRGVAVLVGGTVETPGAMILAGTAALRAGAGKLQIVTVEQIAAAVAVAIPEARVIGLTDDEGEVAASAIGGCVDQLRHADAVLVGTGCLEPKRAALLRAEVVARAGRETTVIIDAAALPRRHDAPHALPHPDRTIVMPNPAEAAEMLARDDDAVARDPAGALTALVTELGAFATVRGPESWSAGPGTPHFVDRTGHPALATSGSGDVLAGLLAGLAARGADPLAVLLWGVHVHGHAGMEAVRRLGGEGVLARELADRVPGILATLTRG